jgi:integrase
MNPARGAVLALYFKQEIDAISTADIDKLVAWLRATGPSGKGCANSTINRYLSALSVMLKRGQRMGWLDRLPLLPEARTLREPEGRSLVVTEAMQSAVLLALQQAGHYREAQLIRFLLSMGCRVSEALLLPWQRVTLAEGTLTLANTKSSKARQLPIPPEALAVLVVLAEDGQDGRVFPLSYKTFWERHHAAVLVACDRLQLPAYVAKQWCLHTYRHTCLSRLASDGWSAPQLQQWAGHSSLNVTQRYVHQSCHDLKRLVNKERLQAGV